MDCRSTERRQWIIDNYNVVPDVHAQLLANQTKYSDAGSIIKNEYYIFRATNKVSGENEVIQCGMGAARDFLRLLKHKGLPLFNPLHGNGKAGGITGFFQRAGGRCGRNREEAVFAFGDLSALG